MSETDANCEEKANFNALRHVTHTYLQEEHIYLLLTTYISTMCNDYDKTRRFTRRATAGEPQDELIS